MKVNSVNIITTQGTQGVPGLQGPLNVTGVQGVQGAQGITGIRGSQGPTGIKSLNGRHNIFPTASGDVISCAFTGTLNPQTVGSLALRLTVLPFIPANNVNYSSFLINVTTAAAGGLTKIVVYSNSNDTPNTLLYESASLDCSTTGYKTASVSGTFTAGTTYWIGYLTNIVGVTCAAIANTQLMTIGMSNFTGVIGYYRSLSTYVVPSTFGSLTSVNYGCTLVGITIA